VRGHRACLARTATLALACGLLAMLLLAGTAAAAPTFDSSFTAGTSQGLANPMTPTWISVNDSTGDVYVIDSANDSIDVFDADGNFLSDIPGSVTDARSFSFGAQDDIAVDNSGGANDGRIYVESQNAALVFAFDSSGSFLWQSNAGGFVAAPGGIAVDPAGNPWVGDVLDGVQKLSPVDGSTVGSPILTGTFPANLEFDSAGNVAVVIGGGGVDVFDQSGTELHRDESGIGNTDVAVETVTNSVYSVDADGVTVWDASGNQVAGTPFGPTNAANGVAVNPSNGKIYITEPSQARVDIYDLQFSTLGVTVNGAGSGRVDATSGPISGCTSSGGTCSDRTLTGSTITLVAAQDAGSNFTGWTGCDNPSGNTCTVSLTSDRTVTATFDPIPTHTLRVTLAGSGSGTVTSAPGGISCGATCQSDYVDGTLILLTPRAASGSTFTGWSGGGCRGAGPCQITLNADTDVTATFAQSPPTVSTGGVSGVTQTAATLSGAVNPNGAATTCTFEYGTTTAYGASVPCASAPGSGTSGMAVSAALSGLAAGTTYHYRIDASNAGGPSTGGDATFATSSSPPAGCPQVLSKCPPATVSLAGFTSKSLLLRLKCTGETGQTCSGKVTFKAVIKVRVKHGRKTRIVKKTITVGSASYSVAAGSTKSVKLKLTSAAKRQLKSGGLRATSKSPKGTIKLPKIKAKKKH